ncbi:MAG: hypothetical protein U9P71_05955 [Campylobacterota bacterium]|nr:hypothetical protein [Campylobacterota bacterium]
MKTASREYEYLKQLLRINPTMTIAQAAHRVKLLHTHLECMKVTKELHSL